MEKVLRKTRKRKSRIFFWKRKCKSFLCAVKSFAALRSMLSVHVRMHVSTTHVLQNMQHMCSKQLFCFFLLGDN